MITCRDPDRESRLILDAIGKLPAGVRYPYLRAVTARLEAGQRLYGDRWAVTPIDRLITELTEEALDLAAWAILTRQRLDLADLHPAEHRPIVDALTGTIRAGAAAYGFLSTIDQGRSR